MLLGNRNYDYSQTYPPDELTREAGDNARMWKVYLDEAEEFDNEMLRSLKDTLDALLGLVFAALFSAVVTTFVVSTTESLQPDYSQITARLTVEQNQLLRSSTLQEFPQNPILRPEMIWSDMIKQRRLGAMDYYGSTQISQLQVSRHNRKAYLLRTANMKKILNRGQIFFVVTSEMQELLPILQKNRHFALSNTNIPGQPTSPETPACICSRSGKSLTRLLCGNVSPWVFHCSPGRTPRDGDDISTKLCHFCNASCDETPEHVIVQCQHLPQISVLRSLFLVSIRLDPLGSRSNRRALELLNTSRCSWPDSKVAQVDSPPCYMSPQPSSTTGKPGPNVVLTTCTYPLALLHSSKLPSAKCSVSDSTSGLPESTLQLVRLLARVMLMGGDGLLIGCEGCWNRMGGISNG
ncbi:hypothetical protein D9758_006235 [Tetrapyrgos nigripes]|uniref:DUF6535 domain-containing protein n=1 Tax=Tetrapyrgos nigripes TaxID=182062 RepID=A0A8H5GAF2_9AGAR|nr:hypothetical protein D9758_006235 [Tetrapyrgos nigripes]